MTMSSKELPPLDVGPRADRLRTKLPDGVDALLVTLLPNIRYLTGFTGSAAMLLVGTDHALFVTDGRYGEQAGTQLGDAGCDAEVQVHSTGQRAVLMETLARWGVGRLGLEAHGVTWATRDELDEAFGAVELVATRDLVEDLRRIKDSAEVARIAAACAIADDALAAVLGSLADGPTEREVALALEVAMRERGAEGNSFDPIVASGPNAAKPHARPSERRIERNELVVIDFGCVVDGYCSDTTRTVSVGEPDTEARRIWEIVRESQEAGSAAVVAGVEAAAVDAASRDVIVDAGFGGLFTHGTGHGVGLEIHEAPRVASTSGDTLTTGHVVTVEPGIYRAGVGGVRIEDTVVVTAEGRDVLTNAPKELVL